MKDNTYKQGLSYMDWGRGNNYLSFIKVVKQM